MTERNMKINLGGSKIVVVHETVRDSWLKDGGTFVMLAGLCSYGVWLNSFMIELIGDVLFMFWVIAKTTVSQRVTFDEAHALLAKWESET